MSSNLLSQPQRLTQHTRTRQLSEAPESPTGRWWKRSLLAAFAVTLLASLSALLAGAFSASDTGPKMTYTVGTRDLTVTVTERGFLESSENTEIKCKVRGANIPILWLIESGTEVKAGDILARLGTVQFDDRLKAVTHWRYSARSAAERSRADVATAKLAIAEYEDGKYRSELMTMQQSLAIAESDLRSRQNELDHIKMLADRGYESQLKVEEFTFYVQQARLRVEHLTTQEHTLTAYKKAMKLETLNGELKANEAKNQADEARVKQVEEQYPLCQADLANCDVKAEEDGLVVYPTTEPWKRAPEIQVGANVYMGQTLLIMPNLSKMQVKVSIPEARVHRVQSGQSATVRLADEEIIGTVDHVAAVTAPTSRWTGSIVTYDTTIKLPAIKGLMPGQSADVEVTIAKYENRLAIPVAAVIETAEGNFCWVKTPKGTRRRSLTLGDTNDVFILVEAGLTEGDEVLLHPLAFVDETKTQILKPLDKAKAQKPKTAASDKASKPKPKAPEPSN